MRSSKALFACFEQTLEVHNLDHWLLRLSGSEGYNEPGDADVRAPSQIPNMAKTYTKDSKCPRSTMNNFCVSQAPSNGTLVRYCDHYDCEAAEASVVLKRTQVAANRICPEMTRDSLARR